MSGSDLYAILEVAPTASVAEIRKAYFRLAKVYHPDRRAEEDEEATERFLQIQTAYETLVDPRKRGRYESLRQSALEADSQDAEFDPSPVVRDRGFADTRSRRPSPQEERDARNAFLKVQEWESKGEVDKALRAMKAIAKAVPDHPEYESMLGYLLGEEGEKLHLARDLCRRAAEAEPFNPEFQARLGFVYWKAGLHSLADKYFAEALRLHPGNELAQQFSDSGRAGGQKRGVFGALKRVLGRS